MHMLQVLLDRTSLVARCECPIQTNCKKKLLEKSLLIANLVLRVSNRSKLYLINDSLQPLFEMPLQMFLLNEALLSTTLGICRLKNNSNCFCGTCDFAVCQISSGYRYNYGLINSSFCSAIISCQHEQF